MANFKVLLQTLFVLCFILHVMSKIVLPDKLRYLENMLSADAKAAKARQRMESNANAIDNDKGWPMYLAKYQYESKYRPAPAYDSLFNRRLPNF